MSDNNSGSPLTKNWPIITFILTGAIGYGVMQNQINTAVKDIVDAKSYANNAYTTAKRVESRVDVHDVKLEYQANQNTQIISSVEKLTQSTNDLKVVIEGLKSDQRMNERRGDK